MTTPIKPGTAHRFGLRRPGYLTLANITGSPLGPLRAVASFPGGRSFVVNAKGSAVHDTGVTIGAGQIKDVREPWPVEWKDVPAYSSPPATDEAARP